MGLGTLPEAHATGEGIEDEGAIFAEINITPLTDVVLVLLIIVMIYAGDQAQRMMNRQADDSRAQTSGLKVNLPEGAAKEIEEGQSSLVVGILQTGEVYVNGQPVAADELQQIFQNQFAVDRETQVVIKADGNATHKRVVGVMEQAKRVGLRRIAIATAGGP